MYAMLYHDQRDPESGLEADFLAAELEALCNRISPDTAVNFAYNLKQGRLDAAWAEDSNTLFPEIQLRSRLTSE